MEKHHGKIVLAALALVIGVLPLVLTSSYQHSIAVFIGLNTMLAVGLCLLAGYAGQISLGHSAMYGIGAYASAILTTRYHLDPWLAMGAAAIIIALMAYAIGVPLFRLKGLNLATGTMAFGVLVYLVMVQEKGLTGGLNGLGDIPSLRILSFTFDDINYFYLVWALALLFIALSLNIVNSRVGRALRSIHDSETAAEMLGVNANKYKIQIFVVSAVYAGIAGSLYAHYVTYLNPAPFSMLLSIMLLAMVVLGGLSSIWGALVGSVVITLMTEILRGIIPKFTGGASGEYEIVVFGIVLMAVLILAPQGLVSVMTAPIRRWRHTPAVQAQALEGSAATAERASHS